MSTTILLTTSFSIRATAGRQRSGRPGMRGLWPLLDRSTQGKQFFLAVLTEKESSVAMTAWSTKLAAFGAQTLTTLSLHTLSDRCLLVEASSAVRLALRWRNFASTIAMLLCFQIFTMFGSRAPFSTTRRRTAGNMQS